MVAAPETVELMPVVPLFVVNVVMVGVVEHGGVVDPDVDVTVDVLIVVTAADEWGGVVERFVEFDDVLIVDDDDAAVDGFAVRAPVFCCCSRCNLFLVEMKSD